VRTRPYLVFFMAPALAYLTVLLLVAVFVVKPPTLGWIGFAVAATIVILIAGVVSFLLPRSRTNPDRLHARADGSVRLIVIADARCDIAELCRAVQRSTDADTAEVLVVAPVPASPLHFLTNDEENERELAHARLNEIVQGLTRSGIAASGQLGDDDPLPAIGDALVDFPAREVLLVTPEDAGPSWVEYDLERRAGDAYGVRISHLTGTGTRPTSPSSAHAPS